MAYSDFKTIGSVKQAFGLSTQEGVRFLPFLDSVEPSPLLQGILEENLPLAIAAGTEKARSELMISPILVEVRKILNRQISLFSGEEFTIDPAVGLNGRCDFLMSRSPEQLEIEAPVVVLVEAKQADLKLGMGQCMAEMVAAQRFNQTNNQAISTIYGCVSSGILWRFMKLEGTIVQVDLTDYAVTPIGQLLSFLVWMIQAG